MPETKDNSQSNSLVIRHIQGFTSLLLKRLVPPEPHPMRAVLKILKPYKVEEVNYMMARLQS